MSIDGVIESEASLVHVFRCFNGAVDEHRRSREQDLPRDRARRGASMGPSMSIDGVTPCGCVHAECPHSASMGPSMSIDGVLAIFFLVTLPSCASMGPSMSIDGVYRILREAVRRLQELQWGRR